MHKRRLFGQSHWINGTTRCLEMFEEIEPFLQDETSQVCMNLQKCKYLAKIIKSRRTPQWPTPPTTDMPAKEVADALVDIYLRTIESVYRILHIPSFRQDYEALWAADTAPDMAFLVQLKLIFSIGAAMYDDHFSLLPSAIRWVHEAQTWFSEPEFKTRLTISFLQTNILLLLAREIVGVDGTLTWISAGSLFRTAVYMGLHRDPAYLPRRSTFAAEMHRRIWNTILEITLQMSMESGGPPLLSMDDFDTNPPGNLDDDQITIEDAVPKPPEEFTQMSIALALRRLFPVRLAIMRSLNSIGTQNTYDETLRLDSELRATYKSICRTLQASHSRSGGRPSKFQTHRLEYLVQRYFLALHVPFFAPAMQETAYAFTRRVVLESCIKAWCALHPSSSMMGPSSSPAENQDLTRLVTCGFGLARAVSMLVSFLVSAELQAQLQEDESLGPVPLRRDLLTILDDAKTWSWKSIEAGEMNTKGYMLLCMTSAQIEGMVRGLPKEQFPGVLVKAAEDATARSLSLLEERAGGNESDSGIDFGELGGLVDSWPDMMGDWGFLVPDAHLDLDDFESMNWAYSGST
ncbi:hypothetical protein BDV59DRAFT_190049 [Aspergillus ambiguus]|uniref:fungal specific transcription factor domain-containing protein n=1 Tax=Aspergillus ambiguus TaxID=176160 RepID=UPI003CCD3D61